MPAGGACDGGLWFVRAVFGRRAVGGNRPYRSASNARFTAWIFVLLMLVAAEGWGADPNPAWRVLIEPKFMKPPVTYEIPKSQRAALVPALLDKDGEPVYLSAKEFKNLGVDWKTFLAAAGDNATAELKKLTPEYTRNRKKVIEYATLSSESDLTASTVLSPEFLKMFKDTLGDKVIVVIPNRYTVYVFPVLASNYQDFTLMVSEAYRATAHPVSMEAYELSDKGLTTIGLYEQP